MWSNILAMAAGAGLILAAALMQRAAAAMTDLRVPLYVTAHDFDYIARLMPAR